MRVSKEKAAENRVAILQAASRLFRKQGIDGVGVAEIAREAGLTHGALYAHFPSKDALVAEAFSHGFQGNIDRMRKRAGGRQPSFDDYLGGLLAPRMRDNPEIGCPLAASASEIGRQGHAVSDSFTQAFEEMVSLFQSSLEPAMLEGPRRQLAMTAIAAQIGAIAVSRAVAKTDMALADEVLQAVRETLTRGLFQTRARSTGAPVRAD
jgi:TetR/AcrR family transcriptional repressor of nem operon